MALLFDISSDNVGLHLKNNYAEGKLLEEARQVRRSMHPYNLDAIISVGYRIMSAAAT